MANSQMRTKLPENHPTPRASTSASKEKASSSWILRDKENKLQICDLKLLQDPAISYRKFLNFVTILGPARQGKSFLMNCLIGEEVFGTADTMDVCTKGVKLGHVFQRTGEKGCILFVDTEGQGDEDVDSDAALLTPVILLSKVILFNWKGGMQKERILNDLAILVEVGNCVSSQSFRTGISKFGHLHILMRDFHFQGSEEDAFKMIFGKEEKRGQQVKERNKIREKLLSSFESVSISILPAPCDTTNEVIHDLKFAGTTEDFQKGVGDLKKKILKQTREPRCFENIVIHSENTEFFLNKFVEEIQKGDIVHLNSIVSQFQRSLVDKARREFEEALLKAYEEIDVPIADGIEQKLESSKDKLLKIFENQTAKSDMETTYRDDVFEKLIEFADREMEAKRRENLLAMQRKENEQEKQLKEAARTFTAVFEKELARENKGEVCTDMEERLNNLVHLVVTNFQESTKNLGWISKDVKEEIGRLTNWAKTRVREKVEAKRKEDENKKKALQKAHLTKAVDKFRHAVENWLQNSHSESSQRFRQQFQVELEQFLQEFQRSTRGLSKILEQTRNLEQEKLRSWAVNGMEVKAKALQDAEQEKLRVEEEMRRLRAQAIPLNSYMTPPSSPFSIHSNARSSTSGKFYKGGQFTPGGGRAPAGGCYMTPPSRSYTMPSNFSRSSSGGGGGVGRFTKEGSLLLAVGVHRKVDAGSDCISCIFRRQTNNIVVMKEKYILFTLKPLFMTFS